MVLNERLTTTLGSKMAPALRVAAKKAPLCVAYRDVGEEREQERKLCARYFGPTKVRSPRLDWRFFRHNADYQIIVNAP